MIHRLISFSSLLFLFLSANLFSDGKIYYVREYTPPHDPYQRAILAYHEGTELLLIQPNLVGQGKDFGWIVPIPKEPRIGHMDLDNAESTFRDLSRKAQPLIIHVGDFMTAVALTLLVICLGILLALLILEFLGYKKTLPRSLEYAILFTVILAAIGLLFGIPGTLGTAKSIQSVTVLSTHKVGIYEAKVLKATDAGALREWLTQNGFRFTPEDEQTFRDYISKGWLFVTARISAETDSSSAAVQGMIQPLALHFATSELVYPFALTATSETPTEVLLYVMADHPVSHPALQTEFTARRKTLPFYHNIIWSDGSKTHLLDKFPAVSFLTKLKGRLSSEKVKDDLVLQLDLSDRPYLDKIWIW